MATEAVEHDYHLVDPSPWPFLSGMAALVWGLGMVIFFAGLVDRNPSDPNALTEFFFARGIDTIQGKDVSNGGWLILLLGTLFAACVMFSWWRDVFKEAEQGDHTPVVEIGLRYGMIMFLMQEAMFFVGWFWMFFEIAFFHKDRTSWNTDILPDAECYGPWPICDIETINPWHIPLMNTLVLLLSGTTVTWAHYALLRNDRQNAKKALFLTVLLGFIFTGLQAVEYIEAYHHREDSSFWLSTNVYGSDFFLATGFHGLHVIIGTIFLLVCLFALMRGHFKPEKHFGFEAAAWYWHFVDVIWIFLFVFVYVIFQ